MSVKCFSLICLCTYSSPRNNFMHKAHWNFMSLTFRVCLAQNFSMSCSLLPKFFCRICSSISRNFFSSSCKIFFRRPTSASRASCSGLDPSEPTGWKPRSSICACSSARSTLRCLAICLTCLMTVDIAGRPPGRCAKQSRMKSAMSTSRFKGNFGICPFAFARVICIWLRSPNGTSWAKSSKTTMPKEYTSAFSEMLPNWSSNISGGAHTGDEAKRVV
mmetsp:Transcript_66013/g.183875  ORF Transcript_66013/g.183875 Transcript_66013/m.183875 type:complete len:218 (-) Transcript_66013:789-1442(-)